ncbi:MAG: adenylate/guanylate cyclase domain-containing protein [Betaproteobacteria bacterium]
MWPWSEIRLLKDALRLYAGEQVLSRVLLSRERAFDLSGDVCDVTLMFVDIASLSSAEELDPGQLSNFMAEYLEIVTANIVAHEGTLDSYNGDAVFAWWDSGDSRLNARNACNCAKQIVTRIEAQNALWSSQSRPALQLKIGINSGSALLGNYGTASRIRFTALGSHVNLASQLCELAGSVYAVPVVISGNTNLLLRSDIATTPLPSVNVKGTTGPIQLFAI